MKVSWLLLAAGLAVVHMNESHRSLDTVRGTFTWWVPPCQLLLLLAALSHDLCKHEKVWVPQLPDQLPGCRMVTLLPCKLKGVWP